MRFLFVLPSLLLLACESPHKMALPSGAAQPTCITDSTGLYCASIIVIDAGNDATPATYAVKVVQ